MKPILQIFSVALLLFIGACANRKIATREVSLEPVKVSSSTSIYRASEPIYWDITDTRVALDFNIPERVAYGRAWIILHPYAYPMDTLTLDARTMKIDSLQLVEGGGSIRSYKYENDKIRIQFAKAYSPKETIKLYVKYTAMPYAAESGGSKAITDDRGLYFINADSSIHGKPVQIWTQGETQSNSHWMPTNDRPNERFTLQMELTVPAKYTTLGSGAKIKSYTAGNDKRVDIWRIDQPIQAYAAMFAVGVFSIVQDKEWKGKEISYYVEPEYAPYARMMFNHTPEMMEYFSHITGVPYPWNKYSQIVARDYVSGAMENTTATLFGEFMNQNHREIKDKNYEDIVSHELFHQWFGDYVTAESWSNLTVNESFANYSEQLWRAHYYGKASADELAYNDLSKYLSSAESEDPPLVRFEYADREDMFDRISYEKGGAVLNYIHGLAGDDAFFKAMNLYLTRHALGSGEAHQWRIALEDATGLDWNWFFNQFYYKGGHPYLKIDYEYNDKDQQLVVKVNQAQSDSSFSYRLPLKAALLYGDRKEVIDWNITTKRQQFTYPYHNGIRPVFVPDQEHWLPGQIRDNKKPEQWLTQIRASDDFINKRRALGGAFQSQGDSNSFAVFHAALRDTIPAVRTYALALLERVANQARWKNAFGEEAVSLATLEVNDQVKAAAFGTLGAFKTEKAKQIMIDALSDSSYMVSGAALDALERVSKDTAYNMAVKMLDDDPKAQLETAIWFVIAQKGAPKDIALFQSRANYVYGSKKLSLTSQLYFYMLYTEDDAAFEKGMKILTDLAQKESIKSYRYAIGSLVFATVKYFKVRATTQGVKQDMAKGRVATGEKYEKLLLESETDQENLAGYRNIQQALD
jgi:aminopeptidase N